MYVQYIVDFNSVQNCVDAHRVILFGKLPTRSYAGYEIVINIHQAVVKCKQKPCMAFDMVF